MSAPDPTTQRRYRGKSGEERRAGRRARILEAALQLYGTHGYLATSIEALCAAGGVSTRSFYEEFPGREEVLMALHDLAIGQAMEAVTVALETAGENDLVARVTAAARAFVGAMTPDPRWSRIAYVEIVGISPRLEKQRHDWMERWAQLTEDEYERLAARGLAPRRDFALTAVGLVGAINELVGAWILGERPWSVDAVVEEMVRFVVAALTAP